MKAPRGKEARDKDGGRTRAKPPSREVPGSRPFPPGLKTRQLAQAILAAVLDDRATLDDALAHGLAGPLARTMEGRDRALAHLIAATVLRRHGEITSILQRFLSKGFPAASPRLRHILLVGAGQLLFLETPPHAAISLAVDLARNHGSTRRYTGLVNAVLRRVATEGPQLLPTLDPVTSNIPPWLLGRWRQTYGEDRARAIAEASLCEAPLDLSVKADAAGWAERLGGKVLPTGTVRVPHAGRIEELPGYAEGAWWVQDAAAALPPRLLGDVAGLDVADLCAAPGGKTAALAAAGAKVTAVDVRAQRLQRLSENLRRLQLEADVVEADVATWDPGRQFDAVLLDAPCTSTGTIRRHPDIQHLKRAEDVAAMATLQEQLFAAALKLVKPGGRIVYCTCSLEPEEGEYQVERVLARHPTFSRFKIDAVGLGGSAGWLTAAGDLRTLPSFLPAEPRCEGGLDGFFAACLARRT